MPWFSRKEPAPRPPGPLDPRAGDPCTVRVDDVYHIQGIGYVPVGEVLTGTLRPGMRFTVKTTRERPPGLDVIEVVEVQVKRRAVAEAYPGDKAGLKTPSLRPNGVHHARSGTATADLGRGDILVEWRPDPAQTPLESWLSSDQRRSQN